MRFFIVLLGNLGDRAIIFNHFLCYEAFLLIKTTKTAPPKGCRLICILFCGEPQNQVAIYN